MTPAASYILGELVAEPAELIERSVLAQKTRVH